jgi:hypothetical protein
MREMDGYHFIGYYGVFYLFMVLISLISFIPVIHNFMEPIMGIVFPLARGNSLPKFLLIVTGMYWGMVLFYTLVIQKIRLKF